MPVSFTCRRCSRVYQVREDAIGSRVRCPDCGTVVHLNPMPARSRPKAAVATSGLRALLEGEEMTAVHGWRLGAVIECALYCQRIGTRLTYDELRDICRQLDVDTGRFDGTLDYLIKQGRVSCELTERQASERRTERLGQRLRRGEYHLDRARRLQFPADCDKSDPDVPPPEDWQQDVRPEWRGRLRKVLTRTLLVTIITGLGSQLGGWVGAAVTGVLASLLAVVLPGVGDHSPPHSHQ